MTSIAEGKAKAQRYYNYWSKRSQEYLKWLQQAEERMDKYKAEIEYWDNLGPK